MDNSFSEAREKQRIKLIKGHWLGLHKSFCLILCVSCLSNFQNMSILCLLGDLCLNFIYFMSDEETKTPFTLEQI